MFSFLFGKPAASSAASSSAAAAAAARPTGPSESTMATLKLLSDRESDLDKRITLLDKNIERLHAEAVAAHKAGQKTKAIMALKKKTMYEEQVKTNSAMLLKIVEQRAALESTFINTDTLNVMSHATKAMKAEQAAWSVERVHDLTDELHDIKDAHREINELLQEPFSDGPSEEDLLETLGEMAAAAAPTAPATAAATAAAPVAAAAAPLPDLPAVPTTALPVPAPAAASGAGARSADSEIERQLAELAAAV
jgi:hypothetical protein